MIERKPREQQTPRTEALFLLGEIDQIYSQLTQEPQGHFAKNLFPLLYDDPTTSGDNAFLILESEWARTLQEPKPFPVLLHLITVSAAYAVEALKAYANDLPTAWPLLCEARYWLGFIDGDSTRYDYAKAIGSHASRKANNVRHAENHDLKKDALEYYAKNIAKFKNKQKAAEAIAGKIVPVGIRTVYGWITEYHKNLHSPVESGF